MSLTRPRSNVDCVTVSWCERQGSAVTWAGRTRPMSRAAAEALVAEAARQYPGVPHTIESV